MIVVVLITIATGAVLLWALYTEPVPPLRSRQGPRWAGLPSPADIRRRDFPLAVGGYDPQAVDAHLRAVSDAYATVRARLESPGKPPVDDLDAPRAGGTVAPPVGAPTPPAVGAPTPPPVDRPDTVGAVPWAPPPTTASMPSAPPPGSDPGTSASEDKLDPPDGQDGSSGPISDD